MATILSPFFAVGLGSGVLHELNSVIDRNNIGDFKENGLQDGVNESTQTDLLTNADTVDGIELNIILSDEGFTLPGSLSSSS